MGSSRPVLPEHRQREWHGGPTPKPLADRFWPKVEKPPAAGCWRWMGSLNQDGYGQIGFTSRKLIHAHRAAWLLTHGEIPRGLQVLHTCDNPPCVNPAHLWLGTHADNMADASRKGRLRGRTKRAV